MPRETTQNDQNQVMTVQSEITLNWDRAYPLRDYANLGHDFVQSEMIPNWDRDYPNKRANLSHDCLVRE